MRDTALQAMKKIAKSKTSENITKILKCFKDDWLTADIVLPAYKGIRYSSLCISPSRSSEFQRARMRERQTLYYLQRKGWIEAKKTAEGLLVRLSDAGKQEQLIRTIRNRPKLKKGTVCLVMFDIPEEARDGRDAFRYFLQDAGFSLVQRSVWSTDVDVVDDVRRFIKETKISKWVKVCLGKLLT